MVVAGVFLFFKLHFFLMTNFSVILVLLFVRALTNILSSVSAFFFKDQKKVIALSTTRQLRFIIFLLCLGEKEMGFFHIILHGFFKALLFLRRGIFIHQRSNYQNYYMQSVSSSSSIFFRKVFFFRN
jgi:NADH-quinone oxidoreductase subunit L